MHGQVGDFTAKVAADLSHALILGTWTDTLGNHEVLSGRYEKLARQGDCYSTTDMKFCYKNKSDVAMVTVVIRTATSILTENGQLDCQAGKMPASALESGEEAVQGRFDP